MKNRFNDLFNILQQQVDNCMQADLVETDRLQNCFWISLRCYKKLKELIIENGFPNELEEIKFFRETKPRFTSFIEFFVIASEASWYVNNKTDRPGPFWRNEIEKYSRFCVRHSAFINYYHSGNTDLNKQYFIRITDTPFVDFGSKIFDETADFHSRKDWVVRSYFAHKMYVRFAKNKLAAARENPYNEPVSFSQMLLECMETPMLAGNLK